MNEGLTHSWSRSLTISGSLPKASVKQLYPVVQRYFRSLDLVVEQKADVSPVTLADQTIERLWRELIEKTYPDHGIIGEEEAATGADREFVWVLDPIDGTRAFVGGFPMFTNLFALLHQGRPLFSGICVPVTQECWLGSVLDGGLTTFNGQTGER